MAEGHERSAETAEPARTEAFERRVRLFREDPLFTGLVARLPVCVLVLDGTGRVVFANRMAMDMAQAGPAGLETPSGPGDLMGCIHAREAPFGCGTAPACIYCGALRAIRESQRGGSLTEECRLTVQRGPVQEAVDLRVWASPLRFAGETYSLLVLADIADEKRRESLERTFLHDIGNTAMALQLATHMLVNDALPEPARMDCTQRADQLSVRLLDEIQGQKILLAAERGELELRVEPVSTRALLADIERSWSSPELLDGRRLAVSPAARDLVIASDPTLVGRILLNMVRNALEASAPGECVRLSCAATDGGAQLSVHNPTYMPENIRLQVFQRSFSTKGPGRGLGTYSMKFLAERYLGGKVGFASTEAEGTTFHVWLPLERQEP